ncbi:MULTISPECIES: tRNA guanosine(34) transglycosylase Tgt [Halobacteriovorax]|uniref:Queuine tRNA-ribosyltransferase n=1 Tax=Halobacteriovorax vibrionivorans TaxID=2152716 RepID=A0ABY0IH62_9BACT|nr:MULTISPECIES: tRNA guanosine(34) transglycosylase Tgt [Halobacteriovorax]AYF44794.1 tRNA-guanine transglycosylase [Halobacteriovorax sp. BALOs_7]RZF20874.1 tRNA guanosine(34) transglycosylase Tgt [Halobacteriovorax vibrionivorans]TGD46225.1 tRNA guanosine(34) transglycosylase Tgt [Halobacteriovorax sp. Y22]
MRIQDQVKEHFQFKVVHEDKKSGARAGVITTPHGEIPTPVFMPVGTHGAIKALPPNFLEDLDTKIILSNTYHLHLSPGSKLVKKAGGLHKFMNWPRPILTDSGGFQVFSLQRKSIKEEGAEFKDHKGKTILLSPETSIEIQQELGSDIMMAFDECIPYPATREYTKKSIDRTHRWLDRCIESWTNPKQALFGIIQGSTYDDYRDECLDELVKRDLPGYAIGGVSVGEGPELMEKIVKYTGPKMPKDKPRYVMGVGNPEDLCMIWENGIDMSDCIIPTKFARGGTLFTRRGKIRIRHKNYRRDFFPIEPNCKCYCCQNFTRAYVKHLFDSNEILGQVLATMHNIEFYKNMAEEAREAILDNRYSQWKEDFLKSYKKDDGSKNN